MLPVPPLHAKTACIHTPSAVASSTGIARHRLAAGFTALLSDGCEPVQ